MMTRTFYFIISIMLSIAVMTGCDMMKFLTNPDHGQDQQQHAGDSQTNESDQEKQDEEEPSNGNSNDRSDDQTDGHSDHQVEELIMEQIAKMTLEQKIGQLFIVGMEGTSVSEQTRTLVNEYHIGGMIAYGKNIENAAQTLALLNELKQANESNPVPLFLTIDQEGGSVSRLPNEIATFPASAEIGRMNDEQFAFQIGQLLGEAAAAFGFNMNYAPVLDINSNPQNPVIGERSYGADADLVTKMGVQTMLGMQSKQMIPVVKHFPGHGDTSVDSHFQLPVVHKNLNELRQFELIPFIEALSNGADAVMVAHILMSNIDSEFPASMSEIIMTKLLREEIGFNGVIMTDDMTMGGITENYDIAEAVVQSLSAGSDIVMVAHGFDHAVRAYDAVKQAVETGKISEASVDEKVRRIISLKQKYQLKDEQIEEVNVEQLNEKIEKVLSRLNDKV